MVRPERFELPASWFVARRSIQLSYGRILSKSAALCGGEGGIRTLDGLLTHTPLAGARLRPLGHLSGQDISPFAERGMIPVRSSLGKAKGRGGLKRQSTILATGVPVRESWSSSRLMRS